MINVYDNFDNWTVWTNTHDSGGDKDGRCIGVGPTREAAIAEARKELEADLALLKQLEVAETK